MPSERRYVGDGWPAFRWDAAASLACALAAFGATSALAQSPRVGHIDEVRGVSAPPSCDRKSALEGSRQSVSLIRQNREAAWWPVDSAVLLDRLRVRRFADVRFRVDSGRFGDGTFFLAPELGRCPKAASALLSLGIRLSSGDGSYRLTSRLEGSRNYLVLSVENGAAVIEWNHGHLLVSALGREIRDSGTTFAVLVDSAENRALLFVREGIVTMVGVGNLQGTAGRAFVFGREGPPESVPLSQDVIADINYHSRVVWTQEIRQVRPPGGGSGLLKVLLGAAVVGAGIAIWDQLRDKSPGPYNGNIIIKVPL